MTLSTLQTAGPVVGMNLILDTVQGAEADIGIFQGRIVRSGIITGVPLGLYQSNPSAIIAGLNAQGMPQKGDKFPDPAYQDYFCKTHVLRGLAGKGIVSVNIIYEYLGQLTVRDTTTLYTDSTQLHPNGQRLYIDWTNPNDASDTFKKVATMTRYLPMRHIVISQTVDYVASSSVIDAMPCVNSAPWMGLDPGFWLFSGLEAESQDNGITRTYTATLSTKQIEGWRQYEWLEDENGNPIYVDPVTVSLATAEPYYYGVKNYNGFIGVGMYPLVDFGNLFGISQ